MRRALIVGINSYPIQPLEGCVNDALDIAGLVANRRWARPAASVGSATAASVELLLDGAATKVHILGKLKQLINTSCHEGDELYFHFSGHGTGIDTEDAEEEPDGIDELICPVDIDLDNARATAISDKELRDLFLCVKPGVAATWSVDACYSGDLNRKKQRRLRSRFLSASQGSSARARIGEAQRPTVRKISSAVDDTRVAFIAACSEQEVAAELDLGGRANGAFS
jgi:metacaspase-1